MPRAPAPARAALRAAAAALLLAAAARATSVKQIAGGYTLVRQWATADCPATITHKEPVTLTRTPVSVLLHRDIDTSSGACDADGGDDAYAALLPASEFLSRVATPPDRNDPLIEALLRTDALFGTELNRDRTCGKFTLRKGALVAFVNSRDDARFLEELAQLKDGKTVLLLAEAAVKDPKRCLYASDKAFAEDNGGGGCFPSSARFHESPSAPASLPAAALARGTALSTGRVLAFSHRDTGASAAARPYVTLTAASGAALTLSPGHYVVLADGRLRAAASVRPGDALRAAHPAAGPHVVAHVRRVRAAGRVNPHTASGVLHVDGFAVSCYTTAVHPRVAHAAVLALHQARRWGLGRLADRAADALAQPERAFPPWLLRWLPAGPADY